MKRLRTVLVYVLLLTLIVSAVAIAAVKFGLLQSEVSIHGAITRDGKPLEWKSDDRTLTVVFVPVQREALTPLYTAITDATAGTYTIAALPKGKYEVAVQMMDPDGAHDLLGMVYDPSSTNLTAEVTADGQEISFDLPKVLPKRRTPPPKMPAGPPPAPEK